MTTVERPVLDTVPRHRGFRLLWAGETVNKTGSAVAGIALPLVAMTVLDASAFEVGLLGAAQWLPWLLFALPAGVLVDRVPRKPVLVACNVVSALVVGSVPVAAWFGVLTTWQLLACAFVTGVAAVAFSVAYVVYLPGVVADHELAAANARLSASESTAQVVGPGIGGVLAQALGAVAGLVVDAVSFVVSAVCLLRVRAVDRPHRPEAASSVRHDMAVGLRWVARDRFLRLLTAVAAIANFAMIAQETLLVVFLARTLDLSPAWLGALLMAGGVGAVVGSVVATRVIRAVGDARALVLGVAVTAPFALLVPLASPGPGIALVVVGSVVPVAGLVVFNVVVATFRQRYVPTEMLGRVSATMRFALYGVIPLGSLVGGALGSVLGPRAALWCVVVAGLPAAAMLLMSPLRRMRALPSSA